MPAQKDGSLPELNRLSEMLKNGLPFCNQCGAESKPVNGPDFHLRFPALAGEMIDQVGRRGGAVEVEVDGFIPDTFKIRNAVISFHHDKMT